MCVRSMHSVALTDFTLITGVLHAAAARMHCSLTGEATLDHFSMFSNIRGAISIVDVLRAGRFSSSHFELIAHD